MDYLRYIFQVITFMSQPVLAGERAIINGTALVTPGVPGDRLFQILLKTSLPWYTEAEVRCELTLLDSEVVPLRTWLNDYPLQLANPNKAITSQYTIDTSHHRVVTQLGPVEIHYVAGPNIWLWDILDIYDRIQTHPGGMIVWQTGLVNDCR